MVSIITPAYRAEAFLEQSVRSVIAQTFQKWELLIVNDGSPDDTGAIADRLAAEEPRIRVFHRDNPSGQPAVPRNCALAEARGRFIAFLDADDIWYPQKLEKQLAVFALTGAAIVYSYYDRMNEQGNLLSTVTSPHRVDYKAMLRTCHIGLLTAMLDCERIGDIRFDEDNPFRMQEDYALWLQLMRSGTVAIGVQESLAAYRVVHGSVSHNKWKAAHAQWFVYRQKEKLPFFLSLFYWAQYAFFGFRRNRGFRS